MSHPQIGLVARLPFLSVQRTCVPLAQEVYLRRSDHNVCRLCAEGSPCDTAAGLYYTADEEHAPSLCPRHFYQLHFGGQAPCVLRTKEELERLGLR